MLQFGPYCLESNLCQRSNIACEMQVPLTLIAAFELYTALYATFSIALGNPGLGSKSSLKVSEMLPDSC